MRVQGLRAARVGVVLATVASLLMVDMAVAAESPAPRLVKPGAVNVSERPDAASAMLTARAQGKPVEDLSARTEVSSTWANPDGTWKLEAHAGLQRFRDATGAWADIDLKLAKRSDGSTAPTRHPFGLRLPGAGDAGDFSLDPGAGRRLTFRWPGRLPAPSLAGSKATYRDVAPGLDLVVEALRTGFEQYFVVKQRPKNALSWQIPLATKGLTARGAADGGVEFVDAKGAVAAGIPAAIAWDDRIDERTGERVSTSRVALSVRQESPGKATLTITPDAAWLADPATQFPVTVDPAFLAQTRTTTFDTFVQAGYTTGQSTSTELKLGNNGSGQVARSFLAFQFGSLKGVRVVDATLLLFETYSWSCSAREWQAWNVAAPVSASTVWTNQPKMTTKRATSTATKGFSSTCNDAWVSMAAQPLAQSLADSAAATDYVGLQAADESDAYGWKRFASSETTTDPYMTVTYNRIPGQPLAPTIAPVEAFNGGSFTKASKPTFTSVGTDADGQTVRETFEVHTSTTVTASTLVASCLTGYVASGGAASCAPSTALADGTYFVRAMTNDGLQYSGPSPWTQFTVVATAPSSPTVTCTGFADRSWVTDPPADDVPCRITAPGTGPYAPASILYSVDGGTPIRMSIPQSSDPAAAKIDIVVPKAAGGHHVSARALAPGGAESAEASYAFGYGTVGLDAPAASPVAVTTGTIAITASGPPSGGNNPTASLKWRLASSGAGPEAGWNTATGLTVASDPATGGLKVTGTWDTMSATRDVAAGIDVDKRVPATLELQVCLTYAAGEQCTWSGDPTRVLRVPHAFGDHFPVADAGPGEVALWTGEFTTSATDVSVPGYVGDLSISRTHSTYAGMPTAAASVFGPGWTASFDGPEVGVAGYELIDNTRIDGTLVLMSPDGEPMVFAPAAGWDRRVGADLAAGQWLPVDDETAMLGVAASLSGTGAGTMFSFVDPDGVTTTFKTTAAPSASTAAVFAPYGVAEPGIAGQVTYATDAAGRVTRILAPLATGMTAANCPATGVLQAGCRALDVTYATSTTATGSTPGAIAGQVSSITLRIWNPTKAGGAGMDSIPVATYLYRDDKRLASVTDPRSSLTTSYTYDNGRLASLTEPGLTPYVLEYAGDQPKLARVKRDRPSASGGGTATLATVLYDVPTSGGGLPDLSADAVGVWGQPAAPTYAAAVFGPDKPIGTLSPSAVADDDWSYADIQATDARGYTINTASYGAGGWLPTSIEYDPLGNPVRELDAGDIAAVRGGQAAASQAGTLTVYNTATSGPASTPAGSVVTDTYGPARWVTLANGTRAFARPHTQLVYDTGSPNAGMNPDTNTGWRLVTSASTGPVAPDTLGSLEAPVVARTGYGSTVDQWKLGLARTSTQVIDGGAGDITRVTDYDGEGHVTSTNQPLSNGADAGSRKAVYYSVAANAAYPQCGAKPEWAGLECVSYYAAQAGGKDLIRTSTTAYGTYLAPATMVETANGAARTTTTSFDAVGRVTKSTTDAAGLAGSADVKGTETVYDAATGLPTQVWSIDASGTRVGPPVVTGYDAWGRSVSYTPEAGTVTTTAYDSVGRVASVADPTGTTTYGYGDDANGLAERRGMPTSLTVSGGPGGAVEFTGAYNADGTLTYETLPGDMSRRVTVDIAGEPVGLEYRGQVSTTSGGVTTVDPDGSWLAWSVENDGLGRVRRERATFGAAFIAGGLSAGWADPLVREFHYDAAGRMWGVVDATVAQGVYGCVVRTYGFDKNSNRRSLTSFAANGDGSCQSTSGVARSWSYDTGDRVTGTTFDGLGRATVVPAVDTPAGSGAGNLAVGYFDSDAVASIVQAGVTTSFTLDQVGRRAMESTGPVGQPASSVTVRHYADAGDNPAWVSTSGATSTVTRFAESLSGDLGLTLTTTGVGQPAGELTIADLHGDVVTTVPLPTAGPATGITTWTDHDEYGNPKTTATPATDGLTYGWLGAKQRATTTSGLLLMGDRLYNPTTGLFTSPDPIPGGGATTYAYPTDPINQYDLNGQWWSGIKKHFKKHWRTYLEVGLTAASLAVPGGIAIRGVWWAARGARFARAAKNASGASSAIAGRNLGRQLASQQQMGEVGRALAGAGTKVKLRAGGRLARQYGGSADDWAKMGSSSYRGADGFRFETHWYQNVRSGLRVEHKTKFQ